MKYYGIFAKGRRWTEVLVTKEPGQRSTQVETGVTYASFRAAEKAVGDKNLAISRERYGR
jgi:hypothetical protein